MTEEKKAFLISRGFLLQNLESKPHGSRTRYGMGCRCVPCREANSRYVSARILARAAGQSDPLVPAARARRHLLALSRAGVGRRSVHLACDVSDKVLQRVINGSRSKIRRSTQARILSVDRRAAGGEKSLVPAAPTLRKIERLKHDGFTAAEISRRLGYKNGALKLNPQRIYARNAAKVERFYSMIYAGEGRPGRKRKEVL